MRVPGQGLTGRSSRAILAAAALLLGLAGGLVPQAAQAQFFNWGDGGGGGWGGGGWGGGWDNEEGRSSLGPNQIYRSISERGFRVIAPLRRRGAVYVADVVDRQGRQERLVISAADAQILQRFVVSDQPTPRRAGIGGPRQQMEQADLGDGAPPVPPASIPNVGNRARVYGGVDANAPVQLVHPRPGPRVAKPVRPRLVGRTPDDGQSDMGASPQQPPRPKVRPVEPPHVSSVTARPLVDLTPKPKASPDSAAPSTSASPATATVAVPSTRLRDPLAIPRPASEPAPAARATIAPAAAANSVVKVSPGTVTGAPAAAAANAKPAPKNGDVPVAPLD